jgi:hypothetical protein
MLDVYEHGAVEFDETNGVWVKRVTWPEGMPAYPGGQPTIVDDPDGRLIYFSLDLPNLRVRADVASYLDLSQYEAFTPLRPGSTAKKPELERDAEGRVVLGWKRNAPTLLSSAQDRLLRNGSLKREEATVIFRDVETGRTIHPHTSSLMWNPGRQAWSLIVLEVGGKSSNLGEVWYAEADRPEGPWLYARKVVTHERYSFYNPRLHPYFAKDNGRILYFEATYTQTFSGNQDQTPRYDYNQIMYKLDLNDPRLNLPRPVVGFGPDRGLPSFSAPRNPGPGLVPVVATADGRLDPNPDAGAGAARFFVLGPEARTSEAARPLLEYRTEGGELVYATEGDSISPVLTKTGRAVGRAWPYPTLRR